jgi:hypothetical protein
MFYNDSGDFLNNPPLLVLTLVFQKTSFFSVLDRALDIDHIDPGHLDRAQRKPDWNLKSLGSGTLPLWSMATSRREPPRHLELKQIKIKSPPALPRCNLVSGLQRFTNRLEITGRRTATIRQSPESRATVVSGTPHPGPGESSHHWPPTRGDKESPPLRRRRPSFARPRPRRRRGKEEKGVWGGFRRWLC